ncbi:PadR family transcriptional regulator [Yinghuangia soli]|uniref:PadR family transcriptional regulator n=1 Tax=Yinghuangia soli TaxID=2908204 RepID=A0AA41U4W6_9ACTN|nr:PadR family transcriptional regulator [Yinghuangia soli]MCF2533370.1 PadR family transcriptional regulator [Yinghuangia soli]
MTPVFGHGRLRLYLLKLLDESPRHGYEIIRLLQDRFLGLYAPSAGTVYPRLAKLEQEGLVTHSVEGGRKVYRITDAGRAELAARQPELDALEAEIRESVYERAREIRDEVRTSARNLRDELRQAARDVRDDARRGGAEHRGRSAGGKSTHTGAPGKGGAADREDPLSAWTKGLGPALSQKMVDLAEGLAQGLAGLTEQRTQHLEEELRRRFGGPERTTGRDPDDPWAGETDEPQSQRIPVDDEDGGPAAGTRAKSGPRPAFRPDAPGDRESGGQDSGDAHQDPPKGPHGGTRPPEFERHIQRLFDRFRIEIDTAAGHAGLTPSQVDRARDVLVRAAADLKSIFDER